MKTQSYLLYLALACLTCGCKHNEFDVSPDKVGGSSAQNSATKIVSEMPKGSDQTTAHRQLPPGAIVTKKGELLPNGKVAQGDSVSIPAPQ